MKQERRDDNRRQGDRRTKDIPVQADSRSTSNRRNGERRN